MLALCIVMMLLVSDDAGGIPNLPSFFEQGLRDDFAAILPGDVRIVTDLRPILFDHGDLSKRQVLMAFDKLLHRYDIERAVMSQSQSDTNYAWLEMYLNVSLVNRKTGLSYDVVFAFHFKIIGSRIAIDRWLVQDLR